MSADVLDFDRGLRALRPASVVHATMYRRRMNARGGTSDKGPPPNHGGTPAAMRVAA